MAREFEPFGIDYFQIDDGYQVVEGDWIENPDRFPSGLPAFSRAVRDAGLIPGIWISPFLAGVDSQLAQDHPGWLSRPEDNLSFGLFAPDADLRALDLSNPSVLAWLEETMIRYRDDWDMGWIKLDFGYFAALFAPRFDPTLTAMESYRGGLLAIDEALGDDVCFMGVGMIGVNYGVVDTMRLTLDNGPLWEEHEPFVLFGDGNNFKNGMRNAVRRYYLHNRVWLSHNDLLFFRTDASAPDEVVTLEEATTLASFMGLTGAIVKFGEDLRTLTDEQINIWRRLLPIYPASARPLDLFERHYAEVYSLAIEGTLGGSEATWTVLGLLNWGRNYDYTAPERPRLMADEARTWHLDLADLGLEPNTAYLAHEFWSDTFLGEVEGTITHAVGAHGHAVIALREAMGRPQLLGHNRHFTQGATDLVDEAWDPVERTLSLTFDLDAAPVDAAPFEYQFAIYVADGYELSDEAVDAGWVNEGRVARLRMTPESSGRQAFVVAF